MNIKPVLRALAVAASAFSLASLQVVASGVESGQGANGFPCGFLPNQPTPPSTTAACRDLVEGPGCSPLIPPPTPWARMCCYPLKGVQGVTCRQVWHRWQCCSGGNQWKNFYTSAPAINDCDVANATCVAGDNPPD